MTREIYFFSKDIPYKTFTRLYDAQLEFAGIAETDNYFAYSSSFLIPHSHDSAYESKKLIVVVFFFDLVDEGIVKGRN